MDESTAESQQPLSVRVLLPDGGELEPPEEQEAEGDGSAEEAVEEEPSPEEARPEAEGVEDGEGERAAAEAEDGTRLLHLHLDGVFLDLLGLEVDLDEVTLDLTARTGEGNLLGNLLSAVGGLLGGGDGSLLSLPSLPDLPNPMERARALAERVAERIREMLGNAIAALPLEDFFTEIFQALVDQLVNGGESDDSAASGNGNGDGDAEPA